VYRRIEYHVPVDLIKELRRFNKVSFDIENSFTLKEQKPNH